MMNLIYKHTNPLEVDMPKSWVSKRIFPSCLFPRGIRQVDTKILAKSHSISYMEVSRFTVNLPEVYHTLATPDKQVLTPPSIQGIVGLNLENLK